jgi:hypothetical protein
LFLRKKATLISSWVRAGKIGAEPFVELAELRNHHREHHEDHRHREKNQGDWIDEGAGDFFPQRHQKPLVLDEASKHPLDVPGALSRPQRGGVNRRKGVSVPPEGVGQGHPRLHLVADVGQHRLELGDPLALEHQVEALEDRKPRPDQRRELLVEQQKLLGRDDPAGAGDEVAQPESGPLPRENVKPLLAQLLPGGVEIHRFDLPLEDLSVLSSDSECEAGHALRFRHFDGRTGVTFWRD